MKKFAALGSVISSLAVAAQAFAQQDRIVISPPPEVRTYTSLQALFNNAVTIVFIVAAILVFVYIRRLRCIQIYPRPSRLE